MKVPQIIALLLLLAGLGFVTLRRDEGEPVPVPTLTEAPAAEVEAEPEVPAKKRPIFSGPHDGTHVYQGVVCPTCEMGPMEF